MTLITKTADLAALCETLATLPYITVDTEFMRESTYWPILCLLQIGWPGGAVAVDPLAPGIDLSPFDAVLANPSVLKVFHAGRQDIEIFVERTGRAPAPLFDSQIAAMVCGFGESVSYETLCNKLARVQLDKGSRYSDWSIRPLTQRQIDYALGDVIHLCVIYEKLAAELERTARAEWLADEMAILGDAATYITDPREAWRRLRPRTDKPKVLAVLREVAAWRETEAKARNQPRGRILKDEVVVDIAMQMPRSMSELGRLRGVPATFVDGSKGTAVLAAVEAALAMPPADWPEGDARNDLPPGIAPVVELLKVMLKLVADDHGIAAKMLASSAELEMLAANDDAGIRALAGWRRQIFGEPALQLKRGQVALAIEGRRIVLKPIEQQ